MVLVGLLLIVVWVMLLHQFRRSSAMQQFVADALGDDTPANALRNFEAAKLRLSNHLENDELDYQTRQRIELALGLSSCAHSPDVSDKTHTT
jgi:hypothetical protein